MGGVAGLAALGGMLACVAVVDPNQPGHYPTCPFHLVTGLWCPGCGTLRALHDLTAGDLPGALQHNALALLFLPVAITACVRVALGRPPVSLPRYTGHVVMAVMAAWTVARNIPVGPLAHLAPVA